MLVEEDLTEDELVGAETHALDLRDVGNNLLNDMTVVGADLVQLLGLGVRVC